MKKNLLFGILLTVSLNSFSQELPAKAVIIDKMKLVNDYWISQNPVPGNNQWARAVYFTGNMDFCKVYPKDSYLQYALLWATNNSWSLNGGSTTLNADNQVCGQVYIDLYKLDSVKDPSKISAIETCIDNRINSLQVNDWSWVDALNMAMPVFARLGVLNNDTACFRKMYEMYTDTKVTRGLFNTSVGLWYRDETYKPPYKTLNGLDSYWSRGNGWALAAQVRVLQQLPPTDSHCAEYIRNIQQMAAALKDRQRTDGFWNPSLEDPNEYNGPETSGTAMFTYGIAWGINNGILDSATYYPVVLKAWNGMVTMAVQTNGFLGYVQAVGAGPAYASVTSTQDFGVGVFLLAGTEVLKLASGIMPLPNNFNMTSAKVKDNTHLMVSFNKKINGVTALNTVNYTPDHGISIIGSSKAENDSSVILTVSNLTPGKYSLQVSNISSETGEVIEAGETESFIYTGIAAITAIGYEAGTGNTPDMSMDFDASTRWSVEGAGQWILYDLGREQLVQSVDIALYNGTTRKSYFKINLSVNGVDFTEVLNATSSGKSADLVNYDFPDQNARYVKVIMNGNSTNLWNSITETRINRTDITSVVQPVSNNSLMFYPNPLTGTRLYLVSAYRPTKVLITDPAGKTVYISESSETVLSNIHLKSGVYCLTVYSSGRPPVSKLLLVE